MAQTSVPEKTGLPSVRISYFMIRANLVCLVVPPVIIVVTDVETLCAAAVVIVNYRVVGCRHCGCSSALSL